MKYLFLDTNILLHYQSFEDIPWKTFLGITEDVTIVVCETVVAEVDKHKDSSRSRLRDRAKKVSSRISDLLLDEITGKLPVRFCPFVKPTSEEENRYELSVCDNRIILAALHSGYSPQDIIVISSDNNLLIKAKAAGLGFYKMKDNYQVKGEPTDEEKELKKAKEELAKWTNRQSDPMVFFADIDGDTLVYDKFKENDPTAEIEKRVELESNSYPEEKEPFIVESYDQDINNMLRQIQAFSHYNLLNKHTPAQIATYNAMRKEYLEGYRKKVELEVRRDIAKSAFKKLRIYLCNLGTAETGKMFITLSFQEGARLFTEDDSVTTEAYPKLIEPQYERQWANIAMINDGINGYYPDHSVSYLDENKPIQQRKFSYQEPGLIHGLQKPLEVNILIDSRQEQSFEIKWAINDSSLIYPKVGILRVIVEDKK